MWDRAFLNRLRNEVPGWAGRGWVTAEGHVAIRGEVQGDWGRWRNGARVPGLNVRYGIESYFVPEGEGLALERPAEGGEVSILVAVDESGAAGIKGVLVDGELRYEETLF
jgi:uncharacterized membrane-anchored protein